MSSITEKVIEYLRLYPNARPSDIANYLGVNINIIRSILFRLKQRGIVVRTEKGYSLSLRYGTSDNREPGDMAQKVSEHDVMDHGAKTSTESTKGVSTSRVIANDIDSLGVSVLNLHNKVLELERKIQGIENTLSKNQVHSYTDKELLNLFIEVLEIIKMCLQAIVVNDISSLNSLVGDLEDVLDKLKHKLKH